MAAGADRSAAGAHGEAGRLREISAATATDGASTVLTRLLWEHTGPGVRARSACPPDDPGQAAQ
ncbi:hypothetical protein ABZ691_22035 [Streptomyces sp. NPDC006854]|uniref:hypothetical protein n=1 Tax=unclassified Streptomyces TaxID=2593676 RepID=UPI00340010EF